MTCSSGVKGGRFLCSAIAPRSRAKSSTCFRARARSSLSAGRRGPSRRSRSVTIDRTSASSWSRRSRSRVARLFPANSFAYAADALSMRAAISARVGTGRVYRAPINRGEAPPDRIGTGASGRLARNPSAMFATSMEIGARMRYTAALQLFGELRQRELESPSFENDYENTRRPKPPRLLVVRARTCPRHRAAGTSERLPLHEEWRRALDRGSVSDLAVGVRSPAIRRGARGHAAAMVATSTDQNEARYVGDRDGQ